MRSRRNPRNRIKRRIVIPKRLLILLALAILIGVVLISLVKLFTIKNINCQSQYGPCSALIEEALRPAVGKNMIAAKKEIAIILQDGRLVKNHSIRMKSPSELEVIVVERKPVAAIANESNLEELYMMDTDGFVIGKSNSTNLPILILKVEDSAEIGKQTSSEIIFATKILRSVASTYTVKIAYMESDSISVSLPSGQTVLFPKEGDEEVLMGSLSLILSRLNTTAEGLTMKASGILPKIIDLRFKNPVLR